MATIMETNKPEQYFIGFDIDDDVLKIIENKKKLIKMELNKETGEPMEVEELSIDNKKKQSTSCSISESMNTSSSTPEYISEDCQAIQSSASPKVSSSKLKEICINNTIIKRRNSEIVTPFASMQSSNYMVKALVHVFKHLETHDMLSASRVCTVWHRAAMKTYLWQNVHLKNSMVHDWERFVDSIAQQRTDTLDTRRMLMPSKVEDFKCFWLRFSNSIKRAKRLKFIELYGCPVHVVEDIIYSLPEIKVLNATTIRNPNFTNVKKNPNDLMYLNLNHLGQMTMLTEIKLKGLSGIKLTALPSFENLRNLNRFSLTSIQAFPKDIYKSLNTITDNIEFFEIGDCECLTKDFAVSLKRFVNLKTLRLENCCNRWHQSARDVFTVIRGLEKLNVLELVNIEFSICVEDELKKCDGIKALLIIPDYARNSAFTNCHLIDCLKELSKTLTHLVWVLTFELLHLTDLFKTEHRPNQHPYGSNLELSLTNETTYNIPILRTINPEQRPGDEVHYFDILSVPALEKFLDTMMPDTNTKVIKVSFSNTGRVYLSKFFNDL